jgi:type IV secretion system protein VirB9
MKMRIIAFGLLACVAAQAAAEERPTAGSKDARIRSVAYDPGQVVRLSTRVGATLVVSFASDEKITAVAVADKNFTVSPRDNFLFLKAQGELPPQPIIVLTDGPQGVRRYIFDVEAVAKPAPGARKSDLYYSVEFTYPGDEATSQKKLAEAQQERWAANVFASDNSKDQPLSGAINWRYVAQGDRTLLPLEVLDNGFSTAFRFPGNTRIPGVFRLDPDGKEAAANYAVKGDFIILGSVASGWRLRDGDTVLCIWNRAYDKIGTTPDTGTVSPDVKRITKDAAQ